MEATSLLGCLLECGLNSYTCLKSSIRIILVLQTDSLSVCLRFHSVSIVLVFTSKYCKSHSAIILKMSSSSSVSGNYGRRHLNTDRGMSKECWCDQPAELFTSGSVTNPGRLYYCCARGSHKRHLFKWVDECLVEEVEDIKPVIRGMNDDISFLILNIARLEKEIEVIKTAHVRKRDECMRNVVVCGVGMAILCYYYFFV
ncbi:hypothetical protein Bca101_068580 [Brassica carinata]